MRKTWLAKTGFSNLAVLSVGLAARLVKLHAPACGFTLKPILTRSCPQGPRGRLNSHSARCMSAPAGASPCFFLNARRSRQNVGAFVIGQEAIQIKQEQETVIQLADAGDVLLPDFS